MLTKYQQRIVDYLLQRGFRIMHAKPTKTSEFLPYGTSLVRMINPATHAILDEIKTFDDFVEYMGEKKFLLNDFFNCRDNPCGENPYKDPANSKYVFIEDIQSFEDFVNWQWGITDNINGLILDHYMFTTMQNAYSTFKTECALIDPTYPTRMINKERKRKELRIEQLEKLLRNCKMPHIERITLTKELNKLKGK